MQRGLELVREENALKDAEIAGLRALLDERAKGPFFSKEENQDSIEAMLTRKRADFGL